jgi:Enoyl-(Acyl carrier protein) reductase
MTTAVVTGSAGGIGPATVRAFEATGFTVRGIDVDDEPAAVFGALDRLDVLVCAHGLSGRALGDGPADTCTEEAWDAVLEANLRSVFLYCKHAIPLLRMAGGGAIVTVSSVLGLVGGDEDFSTHAYAAAKRRDWADPRHGGDLRQGRDPVQRRLPGADRDADESPRDARGIHWVPDRTGGWIAVTLYDRNLVLAWFPSYPSRETDLRWTRLSRAVRQLAPRATCNRTRDSEIWRWSGVDVTMKARPCPR